MIYDTENKLFKMWYVGRNIKGTRDGKYCGAVGYAISEDGVIWHKPKLGLYEFNGRQDNSICFRAPDSLANHFSVVKDPEEKHPQRRLPNGDIRRPGSEVLDGGDSDSLVRDQSKTAAAGRRAEGQSYYVHRPVRHARQFSAHVLFSHAAQPPDRSDDVGDVEVPMTCFRSSSVNRTTDHRNGRFCY